MYRAAVIIIGMLPPLLLLFTAWLFDRVEREPPRLLAKLFFGGAVYVIPAAAFGIWGDMMLKHFLSERMMAYIALDCFIIVALIEEAGKFLAFRLIAWNSAEFDHAFDAVVYAVFVSLGFATAENVLYIIHGTLGAAMIRGILTVPAHAICGIYMGCYLGMAKRCKENGVDTGYKVNLCLALLVPVLIHGFYDFCIATGNLVFRILFYVFDITVSVCAIREFKILSDGDRPLHGSPAGKEAAEEKVL